MSSARGFGITTLTGIAGPPGVSCQHFYQHLGLISFFSPIPKTTPFSIPLNPTLQKHNQQRVRKLGKPVTFQLFPLSSHHRGPLQKNSPQTTHKPGWQPQSPPVSSPPCSPKVEMGMVKEQKNKVWFCLFFSPLAGVSSTTGESADAASGFPSPVMGVDDSRGRRGEAAHTRGCHVCKPKKSHVRAGSVLWPAA